LFILLLLLRQFEIENLYLPSKTEIKRSKGR